jgi:hypothetical protein
MPRLGHLEMESIVSGWSEHLPRLRHSELTPELTLEDLYVRTLVVAARIEPLGRIAATARWRHQPNARCHRVDVRRMTGLADVHEYFVTDDSDQWDVARWNDICAATRAKLTAWRREHGLKMAMT